ncbi:MAG: putative phospholipid ABC transporter-binding protein MlaD [Alphaproteobacteria bacterium MarineAlpha2_Bin1]|nr:MAG: putative phospholipid ABC transporter-binding protein MlaD [Alphaproteobacteria bacterium MarineAlpha2_Bin1]|tara:strand:- start:156 stop:632 length:477 start_codon:yes stop_codon:yes gene_type:complete
MKNNFFEAFIGAIVLVLATVFLIYTFAMTNIKSIDGYKVFAEFDRVDGLTVGSDVRMSGIKIGTVLSQKLNLETYGAIISVELNKDVRLPIDSSAQIISDGLLGSKFLALIPGSDMEYIEPGGTIEFTQSPIILENLLGQFLFGLSNKDEENSSSIDK